MGQGFRNFTRVKQQIEQIPKGYVREVAKAGLVEMGIELKEVQRRTPVLTGKLRDSEHLEGPTFEGARELRIRIIIVCGGPDIPYAWHVHEDLEAFHRVGQAKFLESVLRESSQYISARIARRVDARAVLK
jgi:hypothetical protein